MKTKALTAAQIDTLAQRLSETPIESATSASKRAITSPAYWRQGSATSARPSPLLRS